MVSPGRAPGIQSIKGVGPRRAQLLGKLAINTIADAMAYLPFRYEDRGDVSSIRDILTTPAPPSAPPPAPGQADFSDTQLNPPAPKKNNTKASRPEEAPLALDFPASVMATAQSRDSGRGEVRTVVGSVVSKKLIRTPRSGMRILEVTLTDGTGTLKCKWFNQPFLLKRFKVGQRLLVSGPLRPAYRGGKGGGGLEMENPSFEDMPEEGREVPARVIPVYRATEHLSARQLKEIIQNVVRQHSHTLVDVVPLEILKRNSLPGLSESINACHFPDSQSNVAVLNAWRSPYQKRLCFDEFFLLQLGLAALRGQRARQRGTAFEANGDCPAALVASLPFTLTRGQQEALEKVFAAMRGTSPMNMLLQGDVGSGKTVVALMAMLLAFECGFQSAIMAPTELLAEQHMKNISELLKGLKQGPGPDVNVALVSGSVKHRPMQEIARGEVHIVVGTHALIEEGVKFKRLGLIVVDEQHRFGVRQRAVLKGKAHNPDVLVMTATPIPRTLAMTLYGDLDYSVIKGLPPGRPPVQTTVIGPEQKDLLYKAIEEETASGGQVYVVYPAIEESEKLNLKSATLGQEALGRAFPKLCIALVHGRMKPALRDQAMEGFREGRTDVLVSTTVIEVGVDVPNASLMVVVHAERFGLSQLHQLRGRVGRGRRESRCMLLAYGPLGPEAQRRLQVMADTSDGFEVAREDLDIRGPGELTGTRQSGMPELRVADIIRDADMLEAARAEAFALTERDGLLEGHPALRASVEEFWRDRVELFGAA